MNLALLLLLTQTTPPPTPPLVEIQNLSPHEHRMSGFVLAAPQELKIQAIGAEPWPDRLRTREDEPERPCHGCHNVTRRKAVSS